MKSYFNIEKTEEMDDGSIKVWGFASTQSVDSDGEIITAEAIKRALPDYLKFGAVREMHGNSAAGTAIEAEVQADGKTWFGAHVIDDMAVKKVKNKVYKGFSIGGKVLKRNTENPNQIDEIKLVEISLVDRPANAEAVFTMYKAEIIKEESEENMEQENKDVVKTEEVNKGLDEVARLAYLIDELQWLQTCTTWEAACEGDNSAIPGKLKEAIKVLSGILVESVQEETQEVEQRMEANEADAATYNASESAEAISAVVVDEVKEASAQNEDLSKAENLEKQFKDIEEKLNKFAKENEDLTKRVKELEAMPAPVKGVLRSVSKAEDGSVVLNNFTVEPVLKQDGSGQIDELATAIKKAQIATMKKTI